MAKGKPAPEKKEAEKDGAQEQQKPQHPMFSKLGLIVYGVTVLLLCGLFGGLTMLMKQPQVPIPGEEASKETRSLISDLSAPKIELVGKDGIIVSVPVNPQATEFRHLKVSFVVTFGVMPDENYPGFILGEALKKEDFLGVIENLKPHIRDLAIRLLSRFTYLQLQQESFRMEFRDELRDMVNDKLEQNGKKRRCKEVLLHDFIFSD